MLMTLMFFMQATSLEQIQSERQAERYKSYLEWQECAKSNALRMAVKTREPAATIADAAMGICGKHERDVRFWTREMVKAFDDAEERANNLVADRRTEIRGKVIGDIIGVRSK